MAIDNFNTERESIVLEASSEIEALSKELVERSKGINEDHENLFSEGYILKGLAMRIVALNSIIMTAVCERNIPCSHLKHKLG